MPEVVDLEQLRSVLAMMGCPADKAADLASQLDKRARQLAEQKGRTCEEALAHLLHLMKQGWVAKGKGF